MNVRMRLVVGICALLVPLSRADEPAIVQHALDELKITRDLAATVTNEQEKAIWQQRVALSEKELENVRQRVALEKKEQEMAQAQSRLGARHNLNELLRTVETDTSQLEARAADLDREIRKLQATRAEMDRTSEGRKDADADIQQKAENEQRLRNLDAQIRARVLERDAIESHMRLAQDAKRIQQALHDRELNPKPTVRQILDIRRQAAAARKSSEDVTVARAMVQQQRDAAAESQALSQQRFSHLDKEIETLETLYGTGRKSLFDFSKTDVALAQRQRQVVQMMADSRSQRRFLEERITHQAAQLAALDDALQALDKVGDLLTREYRFLDQERQDIMRRFLQRITIPASILAVLFLLNFILRRLVLPLALKSDSLFVARRAVTYVLGLLAFIMLTLFFLEDLKSIATILGLAGAAVVIALQDLCSAFAGWFVIITSRKIQVGDRIEVDGARGDVVDIQLLRTTLIEVGNWLDTDEATGRIIVIPNSFIFKSQFFNFSHVHPFIWGKVKVTLTFESPAKVARELLERIIAEETKPEFDEARRASQAMADKYGVPDAVYEPRVTEHIGSDGVIFNLYYVCHYRKDDETRAKLTRRILKEMELNPQLRFAYITQRELNDPNPVSYAKGQHS